VVERHTLKIADADRGLALRLVSALIFAWDLVPLATQGRLLRDAALMHDGKPNAVELPALLLAFIEMHKGGA
jgi:hypothetical protein